MSLQARAGMVAGVGVLATCAALATGHPNAGAIVGVAFAAGMCAHAVCCYARELWRLWRAR